MLLSISKMVTKSATQPSTNASVVILKPDEAPYRSMSIVVRVELGSGLSVARLQVCLEDVLQRSHASAEHIATSGLAEEESMLTEHDSCHSDDQRGFGWIDVSEQALKRELEVNEQLDAASLWETRCKNSMGKLIELQIATDP